ncbi:KTSC domain-containing protein [Domibacillus sp. PGB-M46]|uniref:KTSC domain-containing protein n=1 Tax=Domibacillus sp. PGB-M46 TaxID=2910255 RepID=UPI001F58136A|nr:KTSC domain-containing protein [Domibacillus sp. PGB-M46]MCI2254731.1 KTSC domain-containing protein [Domibacillus sp. PGB-M46]
MEMANVFSSHLKRVGYNPFHQILRIEFQDQSIYDYEGVPEHIYTSLMRADSHGKYHAAFIKERYKYRRVW